MTRIRALLNSVAATLAFVLAGAAHAAEDPPSTWPDTIVTMEQMHALTAFDISIKGNIRLGAVRGPAILRAHVDGEGTVVRALLLESCGNPSLDEAALHAMRAMKFRPYTFGGTPVEVSLVVPIHIPRNWGRSW